jgi:glycosyltransferase involved in cell wall biosynthesis
MLRIAFFYERPPEEMPPYVAQDLATCRQIGEVRWARPVAYPGWRRVIGPRGWFPSREVFALIRWCDVAVQWFATMPGPAFAARALRKPLLLVAGGYDTACMPECGYGLMIDLRTRLMVQATLNLATRVLAVSRFQLAEVRRWAPRARASYLYHGCDADLFQPAACRDQRVVTVSRVSYDWVRKGLEVFALTASHLPDIPFVILGPIDSPTAGARLKTIAPPNLTLLGAVPHEEVACYLSSSAVYAQLSLHESFCLALAEGMLSGCTAVVSGCGALPEVAGDCAYYARPNDPSSSAEAVRMALREPLGEPARRRIKEHFPVATRRRALKEGIHALADACR